MLDIRFKGVTVVDGSGAPGYQASVGVKDGIIVELDEQPGVEPAAQEIDGSGLVLSPGFIDLHSHSDFTLFAAPGAESKICQGVTTELVGNCGAAPYPVSEQHAAEMRDAGEGLGIGLPWDWHTLEEYIGSLESRGISINVAPLAAHGGIRTAVMGYEDRAPEPGEMAAMKQQLADHLASGAFGFSTGLIYPPGSYAETSEIAELASVMQGTGAFYVSHIRGEADGVGDAVQEALEIGRQAGVPVHISHMKVSGRANYGRSREILDRIDSARAAGQDVTGDVYPYLAGGTGLPAMLSPWIQDGGVQEMLKRLESADIRQRLAYELEHGYEDWWNPVKAAGGWEPIVVTGVENEEYRWCQGKNVAEIAARLGKDPLDAVCDLLLDNGGSVGVIIFMMDEPDMNAFLAADGVSVGTDGVALAPSGETARQMAHPRTYGTYARVLSRYAGEGKLLSLERAIHKMTGLPAQRLGFSNRGLIRPGYAADLVLFSPERIRDTATYEQPHALAEGVEYVLVNGEVVVEGGRHTGRRAGRVLRRA